MVDGPDFLVIGVMKAGTTTLHAWLADHPDCRLPAEKESNFFSHDDVFARGIGWYRSRFPKVDDVGERRLITGEAGTGMTSPVRAARSAARLQEHLPGLPLVCVVRDPVERLRSHYRHHLLRGTETRALADAVRAGGHPRYVETSCYTLGLGPWLDIAEPGQLLIERYEDLFGPDPDSWHRILAHVGLSRIGRPSTSKNVSSERAQFTPLMYCLWKAGLTKPMERLPKPLRRAGRRVLLREGPAVDTTLARSKDALPSEVIDRLRQDALQFSQRAGWSNEPWFGQAVPSVDLRDRPRRINREAAPALPRP